MAKKMVFISNGKNPFYEKIVNYVFVPGFAPVQRRKNVSNLNEVLSREFPSLKTLEISTKSDSELGRQLSAFNLKLNGKFVETIFQSSKVFADGNQYEFLIDKKPIETKRFIQNLSRQEIIKFRFNGVDYPINPKSMFYDYIYINALKNNPDISSQLANYDIFTDIEFNYKKSINCQARACAIYSYLLKTGKVEKYINDINLFKTIYDGAHSDTITLFDF